MSKNIHPFYQLSELIEEYSKNKDNMTVEELQDLRENLSLNLFYISSDAAQAIANYDAKDYKRKRLQAERESYYRNDTDTKTGKIYTVADSERLARLDLKEVEEEVVEALRQKERVRIIITAVQQILNALSSRITQMNR